MTPAEAIEAARAVAARLREDAVARDRANQPPRAEIALLRESGLLAVDPDDHATTHTVTRIVSAADASIGHILGYHYLHLWRVALYDNAELVRTLRQEVVEDRLFVAAVSNPRNTVRTTLSGDGLTVSGRGAFATGCAVADRLFVSASRDDGTAHLVVLLRGGAHGLSHPPDWDNLGQRLTTSGSIVFDDVRAGLGDVVGTFPVDEDATSPRWLRLSLVALAFQAVLTQILVGLVEGAIDEAARYTREHSRPWPASGLDRAVDDPHVLAGYGELAATLRAARLLADDATRAFAEADARGLELTPAERGRAARAISAGKVVATRLATEATNRVFEFTGARSTARSAGLDRFWRDARTLTLHDPVVYKARELGTFLLTGEDPPVTAYS
ncbi:acyl-CoA dehydrogenase family protein [Streptomyces litchfieldiae]|uniref:Acyl-CoA dehydrogenase family protein n=1 Tax=Streptomyces litchfieldiae TaxID=3075543 RepID=A0ABU2N2C9_9ACTN|nr:acyl-CoA dehydrogenase family protein [Streptomyces sp. DSM 44938]MDT0347683.1 acyl-CoA dehydrogenase family protein [Streptomyces sp. DSM 44938]